MSRFPRPAALRLAARRAVPAAAAFGLLFAVPCDAAPADQAMALLQAADAPRRLISEGAIRLRVTVRDPAAPPVVSEMDVLVQGEDKALCLFHSGPLAGRRILAVGDKAWLLVPGAQHAVPVSTGQRLVGGASIADVARIGFASSFDATLRPDAEAIDGRPCFVLDLLARSRKEPYASGVLWVGRDDRLPRRAVLRLKSGKDAKELWFDHFGHERGRPALRAMTIVHLLPSEKDWRTTIDYLSSASRRLDPAWFTPEHAREAM
jgi:hypothetical protein